jgi:DNA repair protein RadC
LAPLDRVLSDDAVADFFGGTIWPKSGFTGPGCSAGPVELSSAAGPADRDDPDADQIDDQQILTKLITPVAFGEAQRISTELLRRFGTLPRVFAAFDDGPQTPVVPAVITDHIRLLKILFSRLLRREVADRPILSATADLLDYLHHEMAHLECETVRVLFLDSANRLICEKVMWHGTLSSVQCHPREIVRLALQCHAGAVIIIHNHPSGNPQPSASDVSMTHELCHAAAYLGIAVHDHIIMSQSGHFSMRAEGFLNFAAVSSSLHDNCAAQRAPAATGMIAMLRQIAASIL